MVTRWHLKRNSSIARVSMEQDLSVKCRPKNVRFLFLSLQAPCQRPGRWLPNTIQMRLRDNNGDCSNEYSDVRRIWNREKSPSFIGRGVGRSLRGQKRTIRRLPFLSFPAGSE